MKSPLLTFVLRLSLGTSLLMPFVSLAPLFQRAAIAVEFSDGTIHFAGVPRLVKARATQTQARTWGGRYYFTVSIPDDASEPLGQLVLRQDEGADRFGRYDLDETIAFVDGDRQQRANVSSIDLNHDDRSLTTRFDPPIQPGQTVTLGIRPVQTPSAGIYLWGVTVFPAGEKVAPQFIGYGRLHFYRNKNHFHWR